MKPLPLFRTGPYDIHKAQYGYVVLKDGTVERSFASSIEALLWAESQEEKANGR